jgi:hypothetical protein
MTIYKPTAEEQKVLAKLTAVGAEFKPLHKKLGEIFTEEVRRTIALVKLDVFEVRQGSAGRVVLIAHDHKPVELDWNGYCLWAFDVTARRINQLLDTDDAKAERQAKVQAQMAQATKQQIAADAITRESITPEVEKQAEVEIETACNNLQAAAIASTVPVVSRKEKDKEQMGMLVHRFDSIGKAVEQVVGDKPRWVQHEEYADVVDHAQKIAALVSEAGMNPHFDRKDPYLYFSQFKSEPQTLGDELAAMLIEFGLDLYQIKDVLRYAEKDAKLQLGKSEAVAA